MWFLFNVVANATQVYDWSMSEVYLTNDLKFPKENLGIVKVLCTPFNIALAVFSGYVTSKDPFRYLLYIQISLIVISSYQVLVVLYTFPETQSYLTYIHVIIVMVIKDLLSNLKFIVVGSIFISRADSRLAGFHVTAMYAL